jgi:hypothetical protein
MVTVLNHGRFIRRTVADTLRVHTVKKESAFAVDDEDENVVERLPMKTMSMPQISFTQRIDTNGNVLRPSQPPRSARGLTKRKR